MNALEAAPHMRRLRLLVREMRECGLGEVPDFDPFDGGEKASILFLMEKPGPMTSRDGRKVGSGFVSRDNNDESAAATFRFMKEVGIDRGSTVIWNVMPWWNGTIKFTAPERQLGLDRLASLIECLSDLKSVVLVGKQAQRAKPFLTKTDLRIVESSHPSPVVRRFRPDLWRDIPLQWSLAKS